MNQGSSSALVLGPGEGRSIDLGNFAMSVKASAVDTGSAFTVGGCRARRFRPAHAHPPPSRKLNVYTPAAMVGYFDELSAAILSDAADDEGLDTIARRYGMEVVGPVPDGYL